MTQLSSSENSSRLLLIDALRGFALLGIILANIPYPNDMSGIYKESRLMIGSAQTDQALRTVVSFFIDKKFITIFSILFGFGFSVLLNKMASTSVAFKPYFVHRMLLLLLIGCIHAYILWFGDITRDYAICGLLLLLIYKWPLKQILWMAIIFAGPLTAIVFILNEALEIQRYSYDYALAWEIYVTPSYWRYLYANFTIDPFVNFIQDSPLTLVSCFGKILLGFWLGQIGFFANPERFKRMMNWWIGIGSTIGIASSVGFWAVTTGRLELELSSAWLIFIIAGGLVFQSLLYIALFIKLFQLPRIQKLFMIFAPVGKMALTNYLMQTVFCLLIFYHWTHGLVLFGKITIVETYLVAIAIYVIQVLYSYFWLQYFSQGPVEWIWRKLAYRNVKGSMLVYLHNPSIK